MKQNTRPSFGASMFILGFLIVMMGISVLWLNIPVHMAMGISLAVAVVTLVIKGNSWDSIVDAIIYGGKLAISTVLILYVIGMVMGSWMAAGTVPMIIYWGLKVISPKAFLVTATLVCALTSLATGSSWSTGGTVGVALMAVGAGLGISPAMTAGAVVSGSYFGDKMSPLSDTTNLAPGVAEGDIFDHIKAMFYTTIPSLTIALILYAVLGNKYGNQALDAESITSTLEALKTTFNLNILVLIPPILVIAFAIKKVPALPSLFISAMVASLIAIILQGETITSITTIMDSGFSSSTGIAHIDKLLSRGGLQNMSWTVSLTMIVMAYGAILEKLKVLEVVLERFKSLTKTVGSLVASTVLTAIGINFATASQYMSIVITGRLFVPAYKEKDMLPQTLSRTLEDAGTMTSPLVPWNVCAVFFASTLGVSTLAYAPFAFLNWVTPLVAILFGFLGKFQWKTGDIPSSKTYRDEFSDEQSA